MTASPPSRFVLVTLGLALAAPMAAQTGAPPRNETSVSSRTHPSVAGAYEPPALTFPDGRITLAEAIRLTLQNDPNLRLQEQRALSQKGAAQIQTGAFDPTIDGSLSYTLTQQSLLQSQITSEDKKRKALEKDIRGADQAVADDQKGVDELKRLAANPDTYRIESTNANLISLQVQVDRLNEQIAVTTDPAKRTALLAQRNGLIQDALSLGLKALSGDQASAADLKTQRANLGDIPKIQEENTVSLDLEAHFPYRDGVTAGVVANGSWDRNRYKGKDKSTDFGGLGTEDTYTYSIGFTLDAKLLRGRGREATGAFETSANIDYDASELVLKHTASTSILNTVIAYWNLAAAQEFLDISKKSTELHGRRVEVTKALIQGDEIPRAELARVLASQATDEGLVLSSQRQVDEARIALAQAMGISVLDQANAPLAADPFPSGAPRAAVATLATPDLLTQAIERRFDRQAALKLKESGGILLVQAQTSLRPKLDLNSKISASATAETSLAQTVNGWAAPSFTVGFSFEKPIGNNDARGRVATSRADLAQRTIEATDLERKIKANVVEIVYSLRETADQLDHIGEAVRQYGKTIESEMEKFKSGQSSLLDSILTQDLQTSALFTNVTAKQQWAILLARLRFETGTMVASEGDLSIVRPEDLRGLPGAAK